MIEVNQENTRNIFNKIRNNTESSNDCPISIFYSSDDFNSPFSCSWCRKYYMKNCQKDIVDIADFDDTVQERNGILLRAMIKRFPNLLLEEE